jgi:hypothetical protein
MYPEVIPYPVFLIFFNYEIRINSAPVKILQSTNVSDTVNYQIQLPLATNMAVQS